MTNAIYESTVQALDALYPKVQNGGYVIVDDYRAAHGIAEEMVEVDWSAVYWKLN